MNDSYVEVLVPTKTSPLKKFLFTFSMVMLVLSVLALLMTLMPVLLAVVVAFAVLTFYLYGQVDVEYEYLYLDREISVDRIMHKSRRKKAANYKVDQMLVLAPKDSYHLDEWKNLQVKVKDFSSGVDRKDTYVMLVEGEGTEKCKVFLTPNEDFLNAIKNIAPRKVFQD